MGMKPPAVVRILPTCSHTDAQARPPKSLENTTFSCGRLVPVWQSHRPARARAGPSRGSANFCAHHTAHMRKDEGKVDIFDFVLEAHRLYARGMDYGARTQNCVLMSTARTREGWAW